MPAGAPDVAVSPRLRVAGIIAAAGIAAAVVAATFRRVGDFDLGWHLALGRALVNGRALPFADDFSFTFRGTRAADEFLSDTLTYLLARAGGPLALQLTGGACVALLAWLMTSRARQAASWPVALAFAALGLMAAGAWLVVRPALFSFVCLAAFVQLCDRQRPSPWIIPLQTLWANVHGFAALGPALALLFALGQRPLNPRRLVYAALTLPASLVSPFGWRLYANAYEVGDLHGLVTEWTPTTPSFLVEHALPLVLLTLFVVVGLIGRPRRLVDISVALLALALASKAVRLIPLAAILLAPLAARQWAEPLARARGTALLVALAGLLAAPSLLGTGGMREGVGWDEANLPEGAVRYLARARPRGPVWNFLPFGGWLSWRLYPDVRVFIDGRTARTYPISFVARYFAAEHDASELAALDDTWHFQWAIVRARPGEHFSEPIGRDPRWTMVYLDDCAAVYVRNDGINAPLAKQGYWMLRHLTLPPRGPVAPALRAALAHDAALALEQAPSSPRAQALAAAANQ